MVKFTTIIKKFAEKGEKTGWTYIEISANIALQLKPNNKKSFRVKGLINNNPIQAIALLPVGEGNFILTLNNDLRKKLTLRSGDEVNLQLELDNSVYELNKDLVECLKDDPTAFNFFYKMPRSHQNYYSKWIEQAKTQNGISNRITKVIVGLNQKLSFADTIKQKNN
ncbi:MAG: YdeI/OmpD-associated family protein [Chitinophagaceae bacterium]